MQNKKAYVCIDVSEQMLQKLGKRKYIKLCVERNNWTNTKFMISISFLH